MNNTTNTPSSGADASGRTEARRQEPCGPRITPISEAARIRLDDGSSVAIIDFGPETVGGYAAFEVEEFSPAPDGTPPVVRLSYACHPEGLSPTGDFPREDAAYYLHVDNPVLPANPGRHELYTIPRKGTFVAPLVQGQLRYARVALDTPGAAVDIANLRIANPGVHSEAAPTGSFACSNPTFDAIWHLGVRSCQMASLTLHSAWRVVEGTLLPRRLERGDAEGWCRFVPDFDGTLELDVEFRRNPHADGPGFFEVLTGWRDAEPPVRQTVRQEGVDGEIRTVRVPLRPGRFGFRLEKEQWPVIHEVRALDGKGAVRWRDQFMEGLANWVCAGSPPYLADGGKRDRLPWSGDLWWAQRTMYCAFGPHDPHMAGTLRILAFNQTPEGFIHAAPYAENDKPPASGDYGLFASDEFCAWFIPDLWDHYLFTGDEALARELWPAADRCLRYLATRIGPDGLHEPRHETSKHAYAMECGDLSKRVYQNLVFWMAWRDGALLARHLGLSGRADELQALADSHAAAIRRHFTTANAGESPDLPGEWNTVLGGKERDPLSCAMLLASGFVSADEAAALAREPRNGAVGKFRALRMRGKFRYGLTEEAIREIDEGDWAQLADPAWPGAHCTTECLYRYTHGWWDESHPDTSITDIFHTFILGVQPIEPGFRRFRIAPHAPQGLDWARGATPTPHGIAEVSWTREGDMAESRRRQGAGAAAIALEFTVPDGTEAVLADGRAFGPGRHRASLLVR